MLKSSKTTFLIAFTIFQIVISWIVSIYHTGTIAPPKINQSKEIVEGKIYQGENFGIKHITLFGSAYNRGFEFGRLTKQLLDEQEAFMVKYFKEFFKTDFIGQAFIIALKRWFYGIENYIDDEHLMEMYGISKHVQKSYNYLADPLTRQVAYHAVHDIGQMMMEYSLEDPGCTLIGIKDQDSFIIGRNFDFEAGRIFDVNKIAKWSFPEIGYAYLSITWAGMVGSVTGVNEHGLYISINSGGSSDFTRMGTPTVLIVSKALQFAKNIFEAKKIIENEKIFITDIFIVADAQNSQVLRIEKSPKKVSTITYNKSFVVTNHLNSITFANDKTNLERINDLTTKNREQRGEDLLTKKFSDNPDLNMLNILRDKFYKDGTKLHLGNRNAIDALVASHSAIYNIKEQTIYISKGPSLIDEYIGIDLKESFKSKIPKIIKSLPKDSVTLQKYNRLKSVNTLVKKAHTKIKQKKCDQVNILLKKALSYKLDTSNLYRTLGNYTSSCKLLPEQAKLFWKKSLDLVPNFNRERIYLLEKLSL